MQSCRNDYFSQNNTTLTTLLTTKLDTILNRLYEHLFSIDVLKYKLPETNTQKNDILSYAKIVSNSPSLNMHQPSMKYNTKPSITTLTQLFNYNPNVIVIENVKTDQHNKNI